MSTTTTTNTNTSLAVMQKIAKPPPRDRRAVVLAKQAASLRVVRHKYAARLAVAARLLQVAAKEIHTLNAAIHKESKAVAGRDYAADHTVDFEPCPSIAAQLDDDICEVRGAGIDDVCEYAQSVLDEAVAVATAADATAADATADAALLLLPPLPSE